MRKTIMALVVLTAITAQAEPKYKQFAPITLGANTAGSSTMNLSGYVQAVYVSASDGVSTGTVSVAYTPAVGTGTVSVATGSAEREKVWRPRTDATAVDGTALTTDPPGPFVLVGEALTFAISSSPTGLVWRCLVVLETGK